MNPTDLIAAARAVVGTSVDMGHCAHVRLEAVEQLEAALYALPSTPVALVEVALIEGIAADMEKSAERCREDYLFASARCYETHAQALRRSLGQGDKR